MLQILPINGMQGGVRGTRQVLGNGELDLLLSAEEGLGAAGAMGMGINSFRA